MAKSKTLWITRDLDSEHVEVWFYKAHPHEVTDGEFVSEQVEPAWVFCVAIFTKLTGITIAPGQRVKARLVIQEK